MGIQEAPNTSKTISYKVWNSHLNIFVLGLFGILFLEIVLKAILCDLFSKSVHPTIRDALSGLLDVRIDNGRPAIFVAIAIYAYN